MSIPITVARFCRQYLQLEHSLDYPESHLLCRADVQTTLFRYLFSDDAPAKPPLRYQLRVLKELVARIEASIQDWDLHEVSEELMNRLAELLSLPLPSELETVQQKAVVAYYPSLLGDPGSLDVPTVKLLEARSLLAAAGTTGLRTWEASLHLGQFLCANPSLVQGKRVLELGAGTGYLSILCAKLLGSAYALASDGSDDVINNLPDNFFLNGLEDSLIAPKDLKWGHALIGAEEAAWHGGYQADIVLGADITFDPRLLPALVGTIQELADLFPRVSILIAATERNRETFERFQAGCTQGGFSITALDFPVPPRVEQMGPFYSDQAPIHICQISRAPSK